MEKSKLSFYVSWAISLLILLVSIILTQTSFIGYGLSLFCCLPIVLGITTGIMPDKKWAIWGGMISLSIFLILLIIGKIEGFICVLMAVPIVTVLLFTGYLIAGLYSKYVQKQENRLNVTYLIPFLFFLVSCFIEFSIGESPIKSEVINSVIINDEAEEVYNKIINVDTINIEKTLLQKLGMPTPRKCILTEAKIGGKRICVFEEGAIIETIKELKKNEYLKMGISKSSILGMKWLKFDEDIYKIEKFNGKTKITRTTTYQSSLKPRFYWQAIENFTIGSEQKFVFDNLIKDLAKND
jgi:hypothetical protein